MNTSLPKQESQANLSVTILRKGVAASRIPKAIIQRGVDIFPARETVVSRASGSFTPMRNRGNAT